MSNQKLEEKKIGSAPKPSIGSELNEPKIERRSFISWITFAWITFAAALGGLLTMPLRLFFPNVLFEPPQSFKIGVPSDYEIDVVDLRWQDKFGTWIIRNTEGIYALSTVCTHLGCAPSWLENENKFKCPCHGSGFRMTGVHFEGPAPRPLERYSITVANDGQLLVDKNKMYKWENGVWPDESSLTV